jgi:uncharacterized membrane protein
MIPLVVMLVTWTLVRLAGVLFTLPRVDSWRKSLVFAFAAMFCFTSISHFHRKTRGDLIRMVPRPLPFPGALVTLTGVLELAGALGLLWPPTARLAAAGLMALLIAMFPANLHAARHGLGVAGRAASPLWWRLPLQLLWIGGLWWAAGLQWPPA